MPVRFRAKKATDITPRLGIPRKDDVLLEELRNHGNEYETAELRILRLQEAGLLPREDATEHVRPRDPGVLQQFLSLVSVGADDRTILRMLGVGPMGLKDLKGMYYEMCIDQLSGKGILGAVAESFMRLQEASRRCVAAISVLSEDQVSLGPDGKPHIIPKDLKLTKDYLLTLATIERTRIEMLVKTGAVRPKKRMDASKLFEGSTDRAIPAITGAEGQRLMESMLARMEVGTVNVNPLPGA